MKQRNTKWFAFTLIELLVVISIIGILAALVVGMASLATMKSRMSRVEAEINGYSTAIERYKNDLGFYPPDNKLGSTNRADYVFNPLYYELAGAVVNPATQKFHSPNNSFEPASVAELQNVFGPNVQGIANSKLMNQQQGLKSYLPSEFEEETYGSNPGIKLLVSPLQWPSNKQQYEPIAGTRINPIRYDSSSTNRHNRTTFDVWAEMVKGDNMVIIGNWGQTEEVPIP